MTCPACKSPMRLRDGTHGHFYGCSRYPKCRETVSIDDPEENDMDAACIGWEEPFYDAE